MSYGHSWYVSAASTSVAAAASLRAAGTPELPGLPGLLRVLVGRAVQPLGLPLRGTGASSRLQGSSASPRRPDARGGLRSFASSFGTMVVEKPGATAWRTSLRQRRLLLVADDERD